MNKEYESARNALNDRFGPGGADKAECLMKAILAAKFFSGEISLRSPGRDLSAAGDAAFSEAVEVLASPPVLINIQQRPSRG